MLSTVSIAHICSSCCSPCLSTARELTVTSRSGEEAINKNEGSSEACFLGAAVLARKEAAAGLTKGRSSGDEDAAGSQAEAD